MHTTNVLHKLLSQSAPSIHAVRLNTFIAAVQALTQGASATVTSLGRNLVGSAFDKQKIKRMDRLFANNHLYNERFYIYIASTRQVLKGIRTRYFH